MATVIALVPPFVCMPPWVDVTYHDISARNVLWGGVHYRDVFETNLPGMVWHHIAVRSLLGWSSEAIRVVDLLVVGCAVLLLAGILRRQEVGRPGRVWFVFTAAFFYLGASEFNHCQRDGWMLLPIVIGLRLRFAQVNRVQQPGVTRSRILAAAAFEGLIWGWAVWIKPHALIPALTVWLASCRRVAGGLPRGAGLADAAGLLGGGLVAGLLGSAWLIATGAWPYFWDVLLNWNPEYYDWSWTAMYDRVCMLSMYFAPWSLVHAVALPVSALTLCRARFWRRTNRGSIESAEAARALLAAAYLGCLAEATFLQKPFQYAHAPVVVLALAVLAGHRWPVGPVLFLWCAAGSLLLSLEQSNPAVKEVLGRFREAKPFTVQQMVPSHVMFEPTRWEQWTRCWVEGSSRELKDELESYPGIFCEPGWTELAEVGQKLRELGVAHGELVCWYDSTHPLYLDLGVQPAIRFIHVMTALDFKSHREDIRRELIASGHRYVVSDLAMLRKYWPFEYDPPVDRPNDLPIGFPAAARDVYPWDQPIIFRTNRYTLHEVRKPIGRIMFPVPPPHGPR